VQGLQGVLSRVRRRRSQVHLFDGEGEDGSDRVVSHEAPHERRARCEPQLQPGRSHSA